MRLNHRYPDIEQAALAFVSETFHGPLTPPATGHASNFSFDGNTAYSYRAPIARLPRRHLPMDLHPPVLLINKKYEGYSQSTSRHIYAVARAFLAPLYGGDNGRIISVYNLDVPNGNDAILQMLTGVDAHLHAACNTRRRVHNRIQSLTNAENRMQDIHFLIDVFDPFDTTLAPATTNRIYHTTALFRNIPTRSHPCALFSTHTQATVDLITVLLGIRALETGNTP